MFKEKMLQTKKTGQTIGHHVDIARTKNKQHNNKQTEEDE